MTTSVMLKLGLIWGCNDHIRDVEAWMDIGL